MRNQKIILLSYALCLGIILYFAVQMSESLLSIRYIDLADYNLFGLIPLKNLLGLAIAAAIMGYLWYGSWNKQKGFFRAQLDDIIDELKKVVFPTKDETRVTTISVFVFCGIMIVIFFCFDLVWASVSRLIY